MDKGIAWPYLVLQMVNLLLLLSSISLMIVAFWKMRHRQLGELAHVVWVVLILFVPILGALAFLITRPSVPEQL